MRHFTPTPQVELHIVKSVYVAFSKMVIDFVDKAASGANLMGVGAAGQDTERQRRVAEREARRSV